MESSLMLYNGILENISWKKARNLYLANIFFEIDDLLKLNDKVSILEVGAGNCINLHILKLKYGEKIEITGLDISEKRISVAKKYFKNTLNNIQFIVSSITQKTPFDSNSFDIVFSMHCLEQIAYDSKVAIQEMYRITNNKLLMIEPIFENGNFLQKIYLIDADHNRILLKNILELELPLKVNSTINIQSSAWNQSSFIKIEKE